MNKLASEYPANYIAAKEYYNLHRKYYSIARIYPLANRHGSCLTVTDWIASYVIISRATDFLNELYCFVMEGPECCQSSVAKLIICKQNRKELLLAKKQLNF